VRRIEQQGVLQNGGNNNGGGVQVPGQAIAFSAFIEAPELELTELRTTVSVPDKGTLLMGGQRLFAENEVESGVPILSKVPWINRLFSNRSQIKDERTLLILVKPTIILQAEAEEALWEGITSDPTGYPIPPEAMRIRLPWGSADPLP
jgi:type II secretory pathway component GspD/PulD (secretin)